MCFFGGERLCQPQWASSLKRCSNAQSFYGALTYASVDPGVPFIRSILMRGSSSSNSLSSDATYLGQTVMERQNKPALLQDLAYLPFHTFLACTRCRITICVAGTRMETSFPGSVLIPSLPNKRPRSTPRGFNLAALPPASWEVHFEDKHNCLEAEPRFPRQSNFEDYSAEL